jgi:hypothetical protein
MAMRAPPAVWYSFTSKLDDLATNTTLATATRHEFPQITLRIPEIVSRAFKSVIAVITWQDVFTVATTVSSWRIGVKLGSAAWSDVDLTESIGNTADHDSGCFIADVTAYFQSNFGSGAEQTCQLAFAMATSVASNIRNLTARLIIQYEHDDSSAGLPITEIVRTLHIPFQSHHDRLTDSMVEVGTTGGITNAPANQFPDLDDWLPAGATIRDIWIEAQCFSGDMVGTTDFQLFMQIDSEIEKARAVVEQALGTGIWFFDLRKLGLAEFSYSVAHAIKYRQSLPSPQFRFPSLGGMIRVTYTFNPVGATSIVNSLLLPMRGVDSEPNVHVTQAEGPEVYEVDLDVQEPGTITLMQSAVVLFAASASALSINILSHSQTNRVYNQTWGSATGGGHTIHHRIDHSSGMPALVRGKNTFAIKVSTTTAVSFTVLGGTIVINYKSGVHSSGPHVHAGTRVWHNRSPAVGVAVAANHTVQSSDVQNRTPEIPEATYRILGVGMMTHNRKGGGIVATLSAKRRAGEYAGDGWTRHFIAIPGGTDLGNHDISYDLTGDFNRDPGETGKLGVEAARSWRRYATSVYTDFRYWLLSYRTLPYTISGAVVNYSGDGSGIAVDIFNANDERVATTTTTAGGTFTTTVYDDSTLHYAVARQSATLRGRSDDFTPGVGIVTITFSDLSAPVITILDPPNGAAVGPSTRVKFRITDNAAFRRQLPMFKFPTAEDPTKFRYELIHDGEEFTPDYEGTRTTIAGGYEFEVGRKGGWSANISYQGIKDGSQLRLIPFAYDTGGNEQP